MGNIQAYNFPLSELIAANEIPNPDKLVAGQSIIIPIWGSYHWVAPGETLYAISRRYNTTVQELVRINRINDPANSNRFALVYPSKNEINR